MFGYVLIGIGFEICLIAIVVIGNKRRPRMSYNDYLSKYGSIAPNGYGPGDIDKY